MSEEMKIVEFDKYCHVCSYKDVKETDDPCNECLSEGGRLYSHKPLHFKKKGGNSIVRRLSQKLTRNKGESGRKKA